MSPAGRRTGAIGIAESLETYPMTIMRRPLHSTLTVLSCSGLHAAFEVFGVGACEVAASGLGYVSPLLLTAPSRHLPPLECPRAPE